MNATDVDAEEISGVGHLTEDESRALFDRLVRKRLGISGQEFKRRLAAGEYDAIADDYPNHPRLMMLIMLSQSVD